MTALLLLVATPCTAVSVFLLAEAFSTSDRNRSAGLRRVSRYGRYAYGVGPVRPRNEQLVEALAALALRLRPKTTLSSIVAELRSAGLAQRLSPQGFLAARVGATAFGAALGLLAGLSHGVVDSVFFAAALGGLGYAGPALVVRGLIHRRRAQIAPLLPDALDILCVCVQAGLSLDAAIQRLVEHTEGPLADEFDLMLNEMRIGESRSEAFKKLSARVAVPELTAVVHAILQADQQGTPLARVLTVHAAEARSKQEANAEYQANKLPVKLLFPTLIFIFPVIFVAVLGPAFLTIRSSFGG